MTQPSREELLALAARLVVASDILKRKPCEVVYLQQDCLAAAEALRSSAQALPQDDEDKFRKISGLIADLQATKDRFGDTCVYIRRGGLSWGAVALNRREDDKKHGVFDLQAQHDRDMLQRAEQVERLIASKNDWMERAFKAEAALSTVSSTHQPSPAATIGDIPSELRAPDPTRCRGCGEPTRDGLFCKRCGDGKPHQREGGE